MQKPQRKSIFENAREVYIFCLACALVFALNLGFSYYKFSEFKAQNGVILQAKILQNYEKTNEKGKIYHVLKLKTQDFSFYTTTQADFDVGANEQILIGAENKSVKFKEYLSGSFFMPSYGVAELRYATSEERICDKIFEFIAAQHESEKMTELFTALFLAAPVGKELRQDVNFYGVAHLIAISGYHLGLIFGALYFILRPIYRYFQARYFPYRNAKFDLSAVIFVVLFCYLALIGFVPSFLRAFLMSLLALFLLARNVRVVSFELLFTVICAAVALIPSLLFSVGFYFSCLGVFYIYLYFYEYIF